MTAILLTMVNGGLYDIKADTDYSSGCETCDWGSAYVNEYWLTLTKGELYIKVDEMYEYALSEGFMMRLLLTNVSTIATFTEQEFMDWLNEQLVSELGYAPEKYEYTAV